MSSDANPIELTWEAVPKTQQTDPLYPRQRPGLPPDLSEPSLLLAESPRERVHLHLRRASERVPFHQEVQYAEVFVHRKVS